MWRDHAIPVADDILEQLATAILVVDGESRVAWANAAAADLLATSAAAARGRTLASLVLQGEAIEGLVARSRASDEPIVLRAFELAPLSRSDARYHVDLSLRPLAGPPEGAVLIEIADMTRPSRMTRDHALLVQQGGSRAMARQLAHEIKNPLGGLRGAAQLLERELDAEELREYTRVIIREADRLAALVDGLAGPARPMRRVATNVHELVDRVFRLARAEAPGGVEVARDYDPSLPALEVDGDLVVQALLNLARNAVQAVGSDGRIVFRTRALVQATIGAERHRLVASIEVEDDGPGVPPELGQTIFYPLVTSRTEGSGLGLAVAQDIATRHGGLVEFESRPGRTVFSLLLPMENGNGRSA